MSLKKHLENIKGKTWYKQGGSILSFFVNTPYRCIYEVIGHDNAYVVYKGIWNAGYFNSLVEKEKAEEYLKQVVEDKYFLQKKIEEWRKYVEKQHKIIDEILSLGESDSERLKELVIEYDRITVEGWVISMVIEVFDPWGEHFIKEYSAKYNLDDDEIAVLTSPDELTYIQRELLDRVKIDSDADLKKHLTKYYWYTNSWQHVEFLDEEHFKNLLNEEAKEEAERTQEHILEIKKGKQEIPEKHKFDPDTRKVFKFFAELNDWRDIRKQECVCKINHKLMILLNRIIEINDISLDWARHLHITEIENLKLSEELIEIIKERDKNVYVYYYEDGKMKIDHSKDARSIFDALEGKLLEESKELKGRSAYKGKVKGKVKIINSLDEFKKMDQGDVLVSIMTRPEMVPVMKKAAAIVTDEGGITCHAAIVSRELKIPCIVGTQLATSILKDGDIVEVDADAGKIEVLDE